MIRVENSILNNFLGGFGCMVGVFNNVITDPVSLVSGLAGLCLAFYSIRNSRLEHEIKREKLKALKKQNEHG